MPDPQHKPSAMRNLGLALGDLWSVLKTGKVRPTTKKTQRTSTEVETRETDQGQITLRRTTIEEVEIRPPQNPQ